MGAAHGAGLDEAVTVIIADGADRAVGSCRVFHCVSLRRRRRGGDSEEREKGVRGVAGSFEGTRPWKILDKPGLVLTFFHRAVCRGIEALSPMHLSVILNSLGR